MYSEGMPFPGFPVVIKYFQSHPRPFRVSRGGRRDDLRSPPPPPPGGGVPAAPPPFRPNEHVPPQGKVVVPGPAPRNTAWLSESGGHRRFARVVPGLGGGDEGLVPLVDLRCALVADLARFDERLGVRRASPAGGSASSAARAAPALRRALHSGPTVTRICQPRLPIPRVRLMRLFPGPLHIPTTPCGASSPGSRIVK